MEVYPQAFGEEVKEEEEEEEEEAEEGHTPQYGALPCASIGVETRHHLAEEEEKKEKAEPPRFPPSKAEVHHLQKQESGLQNPTRELESPQLPLKEVESLTVSFLAMDPTDV